MIIQFLDSVLFIQKCRVNLKKCQKIDFRLSICIVTILTTPKQDSENGVAAVQEALQERSDLHVQWS